MEPLQVEHSLEQPRADREPSEGSRNSTGMHMQASPFSSCARPKVYLQSAGMDDAEVLLERLGYRVFFGGVYSVEDYRAM